MRDTEMSERDDRNFWQAKWEKAESPVASSESPAPAWLARDMLTYLPKNGKILEAGCGTGKWVFFLLKNGYDIYGLDYVKDVIEKSKRLVVEQGLGGPERFMLGDVHALDIPDASLDGYISLGVIEHYEDPSSILREIYRALKPGGTLFLTVPNRLSPYWVSYMLSYRFSKGVIYHNCMSRFQLKKLIAPHGFDCVASYNRDVPSAFRHGFWLERKSVKGMPNPFYLLRGPITAFAGAAGAVFPFMGYISVFVGRKKG